MDVYRPRARQVGLVVQELPDELLLYDTERFQAHCLNRLAALMWKQCDGHTTPAEIAQRVAIEIDAPVTEDMVWHAVYQLWEFHLLEDADAALAGAAPMTRRELMTRVASVAVALPLVSSVLAPAAAQTSSGPTGPTGATGATGATG
jgi:hypothetical protein